MPSAQSTRVRRAAFNLGVWDGALSVIAELNRREIPVLVLKSLPQVEEIYGDAAGRSTGDVDLVAPGRHAVEVVDLLLSLGWTLSEEECLRVLTSVAGREHALSGRSWHFLLQRGIFSSAIDLHFDDTDSGKRPILDTSMWRRALSVSRDGVQFLVLAPEDRLLFLCWHFFADSVGMGMVWIKLTDIELILRHGAQLDWGYVARRARAAGLTIFLHLACDLAAARSSHPISPNWRRHVPVTARKRHELLWRTLNRDPDRLSGRGRSLLWLLAHDRVGDIIPIMREMVLPSRLKLATEKLGFVPSWPRYVGEIAVIYGRRIRKSFRQP